ncbi:MAG: dTDP-4-dehydrorhamnose reductase [Alphaproteobacteria bacterium]|nr:dTDP-4-dehydrorhamnose reductase [Alphaproteobacteria bacterium]
MSDRPILLFGVTGQVGMDLRVQLAHWRDVLCPPRTVVNLLWPDEVRTYIRVSRPSLIVNAAAYTAVDAAEDNADEAAALNADLPLLLAEECLQRGIGLVHFSTDYVFDGRGGSGAPTPSGRRAYREDDRPEPLNVYGRTKLRGESAVQQSGAAYLLFRCCWVYSLMGRNFLLTMQRLAREGRSLNIVDDQLGSPTWARAIAVAADEAIRQLGAADGLGGLERFGGTYHVAAGGETTWCGFARAIMDRVEQWPLPRWPQDRERPSVRAIATKDYPTKAVRPAFSVLDTAKLREVFGITLADWSQQLDECLQNPP